MIKDKQLKEKIGIEIKQDILENPHKAVYLGIGSNVGNRINNINYACYLLNKFCSLLNHRGPDGKGVHLDGATGFVHRRLKIIDLSEAASQPMHSPTEGLTLIYNGEIYNFRELRADLEKAGYHFETTSDTEVVLKAYSYWGVKAFERFNGMFALAILDKKSKELTVARDRYGIKPLYFYELDEYLVFSSEIKGILAHPDYKVAIDYNALNEYFTFQNLFSYNSIFKDIVLLPPANTVKIDRGISFVKHVSWWDYDFSEPDETMTFVDAKEQTKVLFEQAVKRQTVADVPVGCYLSGGMDSGSITSICANKFEELMTFTCGFDMNTISGFEANYDERRDAELMASIFGTEHYEQVIGSHGMVRSLDKVVYHLEEPRVGMSYPNYYISRLASKFVKVCLQGTGGDELFGGYPWRYYRIFDSIDRQSFFNQYYDFWQRLVREEDKKELYSDLVKNQIDYERPRKVFERVFLFNDKLKYDRPEDHIQNSLYFEIKTFLPGLLMVGDKLSMAHGLEERFPFLDNDLINFAQKIPVKHKLGNLEREIKKIDENIATKRKLYREFDDGKNVLRKAMVDFMPEQILNRKKQGFSAPDENWYRKENREFIENYLFNSNAKINDIVNPNFIKRKLEEHNTGKVNNRLIIWSFLNLESWMRQFLA